MQETFLRSNDWRGLMVTAALAFTFVLAASIQTLAAPLAKRTPGQELKKTDLGELRPGVSVERQFTGTDQHNYQVTLTKGQYVKVIAVQKSIDVVLALFAPSGEKLSEVDTAGGGETLFTVGDADGTYRLEVRASDREAKPGLYELRVADLREATPKDRSAVSAQKLFEEGNRLASQRTADSRRSAITKYEQAMPLWKEADQTRGQAATLNAIGIQYSNLSEGRKAIESYSSSVKLWREIGDAVNEADTSANMGTAYWRLGESQKALESHNHALNLARTAGDRQIEALALSNIGAVYWSLGEPQTSLKYYSEALLIFQARGARRFQAVTLNNIATAYQQLGKLQEALDALRQVIALRQALGDERGQSAPLNNLGLVYTQLGDYEASEKYYAQALEIRRSSGDRQGQATTLQGLSILYARRGDVDLALKSAEQSLALSREVNDRLVEAYVLAVIGKLNERLGDSQKALTNFEQALTIRRAIADRYGEAYALSSLGNIHIGLGNSERALEHYTQALKITREIGDKLGETEALYGLARTQSKAGDKLAARRYIEEALAIIESTRKNVASTDFRSSFFASYQRHYDFLIGLLMQMHQAEPAAGHDVAALEVNERARARTLLEILVEPGAQIRQGVDPDLLESERSIQQQLNTKAAQQVRLLSGKHTADQEAAIRKEVEALLASYRNVQAQIRTRSPRYAALTQPQPRTFKEIQEQVLDDDTLLLEYAMGDERSYLWAVTPTSISALELPKRTEIELAARRVYDLITARNKSVKFEESATREARVAKAEAEYSEAAAGLSQMLLGPIANRIKGKRLLIVSDGVLQYIPFAALPLPRSRVNNPSSRATSTRGRSIVEMRPLISEHEIISLPSASSLAVLRRELRGRQTAAKVVAVVADPVFQPDDPRVKGTTPNGSAQPAKESSKAGAVEGEMLRSARDVGEAEFRRLPFTRQESVGIIAFTPENLRQEFLDFEASRSSVTSNDLSNYRIIHFATHGFLNSQHPELSGIVLSLVDEQGRSQDGFLRLHEIYNLKLGADLVVLSGCRTALGKEIRGEGLVGLTRGFMYAGAPRVVASLWAVEDQATAELMKRFYREMLVRKQRPAAALRTAQVGLWREKRLPAYYWAGFVLQGEWK